MHRNMQFDGSANVKSANHRILALVAATILVCAAISIAAAPQHALAANGLSVSSTSASTRTQAEPVDFTSPDGLVKVTGITEGSVDYDPESHTLSLNGAQGKIISVTGPCTCKLSLTGKNSFQDIKHKSGSVDWVIAGSGSLDGYFSNAKSDTITIKGGKLSGGFDSSVSAFNVHGGTVDAYSLKCKTFSMTKGKAVFEEFKASDSFTMKGGRLTVRDEGWGLACSGSGRISGGTVKAYKASFVKGLSITGGIVTMRESIYCGGENGAISNLSMSGGTVAIGSKRSSAWLWAGTLKLSGGSLAVSTKDETAVDVDSLIMKGGKLSAASSEYAINAKKRVSLLGGKLNATAKASYGQAISLQPGKSMKCKAGCLKTIRGELPTGAVFTVGGNTYKLVHEAYKESQLEGDGWGGWWKTFFEGAVLVRYGSEATKASFGASVKFGGHPYQLGGVCSNAFNTKQGAKLKSITFRTKTLLPLLQTRAFAGTKSLTELTLPSSVISVRGDGTGARAACKVAKKAFAGCGKNKGRSLTLWIHDVETIPHVWYYTYHMDVYRAFFTKYGLPRATKLTWYL